jgi:hypothetical protein
MADECLICGNFYDKLSQVPETPYSESDIDAKGGVSYLERALENIVEKMNGCNACLKKCMAMSEDIRKKSTVDRMVTAENVDRQITSCAKYRPMLELLKNKKDRIQTFIKRHHVAQRVLQRDSCNVCFDKKSIPALYISKCNSCFVECATILKEMKEIGFDEETLVKIARQCRLASNERNRYQTISKNMQNFRDEMSEKYPRPRLKPVDSKNLLDFSDLENAISKK